MGEDRVITAILIWLAVQIPLAIVIGAAIKGDCPCTC
jgi:hypothetical protein